MYQHRHSPLIWWGVGCCLWLVLVGSGWRWVCPGHNPRSPSTGKAQGVGKVSPSQADTIDETRVQRHASGHCPGRSERPATVSKFRSQKQHRQGRRRRTAHNLDAHGHELVSGTQSHLGAQSGHRSPTSSPQ